MSLSCSSLSSSAALALVLALCAAPAVHAETASPLPPIGRFFSKPAFAGQQPLRYKARDGQRVPIDHGTRFHNAVKKTNPNVEWVEYPEEGHGF